MFNEIISALTGLYWGSIALAASDIPSFPFEKSLLYVK